MEYVSPHSAEAVGKILCCQCGTSIDPNPANMCVACIRTQVDISEGIPKQAVIYFCRNCERYLQPPAQWIAAALESRELLSLCLKKLKGLKGVRLVDAGFLWTEPHSKRLKLKLTIEKEVMNGAILQQVFVVEFVVNNQMCDDCHRTEAKDYWKSVVQVRQKTSHKRTFFYLEQLILKHGAHDKTVNIKEEADGLDFYFSLPQDSKKFVSFLEAMVPCRYVTSERLISHDVHSNKFNYKTTFSVEIVPICKDNIVCLPARLAQSLGNLGQILLVQRVTQTVHLIDPTTLQTAEVTADAYWRTPFLSLCQPKQLQQFFVVDVEPVLDSDRPHVAGHKRDSQKHVLADVWLMKANDMSDDQRLCRTHLGHLLEPGDVVLGFDLANANINDAVFDQIPSERRPDIVIVKKYYGDKSERNKRRKWRLRRLEREAAGSTTSTTERDYEEFLEDVEEDPNIRHNVNIYKDPSKMTAVEPDFSETKGLPGITLAEMLDDLHLEDATGGAGASMVE